MKFISRVDKDILVNTRNNFHISVHPCIILSIFFFSVWRIEPILQDEVEDDVKEDHEYSLESENMEEHKSLILHLLSKLKLGMDLTKVWYFIISSIIK